MRPTTGHLIFLIALGTILHCLVGFSWRSAELGQVELLDVRLPFEGGSILPYTPVDIKTFFEGLGGKLTLYRSSEVTLDLIFPLSYAFFLAGLLIWLQISATLSAIMLPAIMALADIVENIMIFILAGTPAAIPPLLAHIAAFATLVKWATFSVIVLITFVYAIIRLRKI